MIIFQVYIHVYLIGAYEVQRGELAATTYTTTN